MKITVIGMGYVGLVTGAHVRAYDPISMDEAKNELEDNITYCKSDMHAVKGADALVFISE